ncbi:MAG: preprotein translocase subunit SecA [Holosporales bacterium]|jgi:preprotein translocase subunit SecA|nr:preprotein translocase subunit SecA [Holosporales bacterium]
MFKRLAKLVLGSANDRYIKQFARIVAKVNAKEGWAVGLSDEGLRNQTSIFKERVQNGESLDKILPEAFAVMREAAKRVLGQRHYDVQIMGGIALHNGMLAEMKTGEGKTLVATLPVYLNALSGKGVHVVTVNDYLAQRDATWMGQIYEFLGLTYGCILHGLSDDQRRDAYNADITYGTNHEFGFDFLRDNMKFSIGELVMRPFNYAIVDEVDSILIDEARTPLIISGPAEDSSQLYQQIDKIIPLLVEEDYEKDEKQRTVILTESGVERVEQELQNAGILNGSKLYDSQNVTVVHHVNASLRAHKLFTRDVDYIVRDDEVIIVDEFTGRTMEGRRYSEGLHQALEAKEHVTIQRENQTLASITYQNFFRLYPKLSGMGGTIVTEEAEFEEIYKLKAVEIPTNRPVVRDDIDDEVYLKAVDKFAAVVRLVRECQERKQPVLIGTTSIEKSELCSSILTREQIPHAILNARHHDREALIIANAGRLGAITIATNMAGRGTDIKLGGNWEARVQTELAGVPDGPAKLERIEKIKQEVAEEQDQVRAVGGLFVIGTERHESRRIDNQLRGRSGRQGDPGASKFFISLEDDLMRIFGSGRMDTMMRRAGMKDGEAISHKWISKAIERAQKKVEAHNFEIRKHLLKYDDVMNDQRKVIYRQRLDIMKADEVSELIAGIRSETLESMISAHFPPDSIPDQWDLEQIQQSFKEVFNIDIPIEAWKMLESMTVTDARVAIEKMIDEQLEAQKAKVPELLLKSSERSILLRNLDQHWKDHLLSLDYLRQGIGLRAYAQSNPLNEYKRESFNMFTDMMQSIRVKTLSSLSRFDVSMDDVNNLLKFFQSLSDAEDIVPPIDGTLGDPEADMNYISGESHSSFMPSESADVAAPQFDTETPRNAPCPCGSGKRYKYCHGAPKSSEY